MGEDIGRVFEHMALWGKVILYNAVGGHPSTPFFDALRSDIRKCVSVQYFSMHIYENDHAGLRDLLARAIEMMRSGAARCARPRGLSTRWPMPPVRTAGWTAVTTSGAFFCGPDRASAGGMHASRYHHHRCPMARREAAA